MTTPTTYTRYRDYSDFQAENPDTAINGADLDTDLDRVKTTTDSLATCLATIRKDDGTLKNSSVGVDQLKAEVVSLLNGIQPRGDWATATAYMVGDLVNQGGGAYVCLVAHTSGTFATDLAADKWMTMSALATAASVVFTPAGGIAASNVQDALEELDSEKQPLDATLTALAAVTTAANKLIYATGIDTFSTTDVTAAARTLLACVSAAAMLTALGALPLAGGTMTGALVLSGNPANALEATPKQYVDSLVGGASASIPAGTVLSFSGFELPSGFLWANGAAHSRATYSDLYGATNKTATVTMTIASPCVVTWTGHGLKDNWPVKFTTTGAIPTGLTAGTIYYIRSSTTDTFQLAAAPGGSAINTSGSQSGVHTAIFSPYGDGDGSSTFNVIDMRGRTAFGLDDMFTSTAGVITSATTTKARTIGGTSGAETVTLADANLPSMTPVTGGTTLNGATDTAAVSTGNTNIITALSTTSIGSGTAVNKLPPAVHVPWIVKT